MTSETLASVVANIAAAQAEIVKAEAAVREQRRALVVKLRAGGWTSDAIGEALGLSASFVRILWAGPRTPRARAPLPNRHYHSTFATEGTL